MLETFGKRRRDDVVYRDWILPLLQDGGHEPLRQLARGLFDGRSRDVRAEQLMREADSANYPARALATLREAGVPIKVCAIGFDHQRYVAESGGTPRAVMQEVYAQNSKMVFGREDAHAGFAKLHPLRAGVQIIKTLLVQVIRSPVQVHEKLSALFACKNLFRESEPVWPHEEVYVAVWTQGRFRIMASHAPAFDEYEFYAFPIQ